MKCSDGHMTIFFYFPCLYVLSQMDSHRHKKKLTSIFLITIMIAKILLFSITDPNIILANNSLDLYIR